MEIKEGRKQIKTYTVQCPKCKKKIEGYSESQIKWNLEVHLKKCKNEARE